jgi:hypothetical protein
VKRFIVIVAVIGLVAAVAAVKAHEGHKHAKTKVAASPAKPLGVEKIRLSGEIIDPQCWFTHHGQGEDHVECAVNCARGGQDLAFLDTQSGELYTLLAPAHGKNPNVGLYEHVGVPVRVRGTAYQRGNNRGLIVEAVEKAR